jgi:hypothetical protein
MSSATTYYGSFSRALIKYVNNGFFARDLDADDFAFIERVRERGAVPCGSLAQTVPTPCTYSDDVIQRIPLAEELEFWRQPYQVDRIAVRRLGPIVRSPPRPVGSTPDAIKRKLDRELKATAYAEEQRRADDRRIEQLRRDIEWEKAAPPKRYFGRVDGRHYVPRWKVDEQKGEKRSERWARLREEAKQRKLSREQAAALKAAKESLKDNILSAVRAARQVVTLEVLMAAVRCDDKDFVVCCADELIHEGKLQLT